MLRSTLLPALLLGSSLSHVASVCIEGVPMDVYCIQAGNMIDNGLPTLQYAHEHTIHCLVDVSFCRDSGFEILAPNESGSYDRAVRLDDYGNAEVIRIGRDIGRCTTCTGAGSQRDNFFVTVEGKLVDATSVGADDTDPPLLRVTSMTAGRTCPTPALTAAPTSSDPTSAPTPAPVTPEPSFFPTVYDSSAPSVFTQLESLVPTVYDSFGPSDATDLESLVPTSTAQVESLIPTMNPVPISPEPTTRARAAQAETTVCLTGVPMDVYCIQAGNMIDNGLPTLQSAHEHTIHCLLDVSFCRDSGFEILTPSLSGGYDRAVLLDDYGNSEVIRIGRDIGQCTTCTGAGSQRAYFFVTVEGELVNATSVGDSDADPPLLRVTSMTAGGDCSSTPGSSPTAPLSPESSPTTAPAPTSSASMNKFGFASCMGKSGVLCAGFVFAVVVSLAG